MDTEAPARLWRQLLKLEGGSLCLFVGKCFHCHLGRGAPSIQMCCEKQGRSMGRFRPVSCWAHTPYMHDHVTVVLQPMHTSNIIFCFGPSLGRHSKIIQYFGERRADSLKDQFRNLAQQHTKRPRAAELWDC